MGGCMESAGNSFFKLCVDWQAVFFQKREGASSDWGRIQFEAIGTRSRFVLAFASNASATVLPSAFSAEFPRALRLLQAVLAFTGQANAFLKQLHRLHPAKAVGFPIGAPLLPTSPASAQNPVFSAVRVSLQQVDSRHPPVPLELNCV